MFSAPVEPD